MTAPRSSDHEALDAFVAQLLETSFTLMTMVNEMTAFEASGHSAADAPPVPVVLSNLLRDVLAPLVAGGSRAAVVHATAVLAETTALVCRDIYVVNPDPRPRRPRSATRRSRRPR